MGTGEKKLETNFDYTEIYNQIYLKPFIYLDFSAKCMFVVVVFFKGI